MHRNLDVQLPEDEVQGEGELQQTSETRHRLVVRLTLTGLNVVVAEVEYF